MEVVGASIRFGTSSKGKPVLIDDNCFRYNLQAKTSTKSHWICIEYRRGPKCSASVVFNEIDRTVIKMSNNHTHVVDLNKAKAFNSKWTPCIPRSASVLKVIDCFIKEDALAKVTLMEQMRGDNSSTSKKRRSNRQTRVDELAALRKNYQLQGKEEFLRSCTRYM